MPLTAGSRLSAYEIVGALGAGGMGEVYRARDSKLGRDVAIKILPEAFVADPDRVARFEREAQLLAALNHPHIAAIYGLDESGAARFLVLELVDGESLSQKLEGLRDSGLGISESLRIARQIIDALEAAHEKGIVHRDLKPGNIMLTEDGQVKVLDFGLAKQDTGSGGSSRSGGLDGFSHSPTLTFAATQAGMILGTAAYMSPEQAKGRPADKRSDVWSFGCVLFEMLSGTRAFDGEDATEMIAAVVRGEPKWDALPKDTPPRVRSILQQCLEKDRRKRIPDIAIVRFLLDETRDAGLATRPATSDSRLATFDLRRATAVAAAVGAALTAGVLWLTRPTASARSVVRLHATPPADQPLTIDPFASDIAISPDGRRIAFTTGAAQPQLYVRELDRDDATSLAGVVNVRGPFFSPDGAWIAYFHGADLKKVSVQGGPSITICADCAPGNRGGSWGSDDTIVFTAQGGTLLRQVPGSGGAFSEVSAPDRTKNEAAFVYPAFVPDRSAVLFIVLYLGGRLEDAAIAVRDLRSSASRTVIRGGLQARVVLGRYLLYGTPGTLRAVSFALDRLETVGNPILVVPQVVTKTTGAADFDVSRDGTLVYVQGGAEATGLMQLAWRDRQGREEAIAAPPRAYAHVRLSPDGTRAALDLRDQDADIWIWDFAQRTLSRFTFTQGPDENPAWSPDGKRIAFAASRVANNSTIQWQASDGSGAAHQLISSSRRPAPWTFTPDGKAMLILDADARTGLDVGLLPIDPPAEPQPVVQQPGNQTNVDLSPDGRWLTYQSNESGRDEIYVRPFPNVSSGRWQVSTDGGSRPVWARNGRELYFLDATFHLIAVPIQPGATFAMGNPVPLFELPSAPTATARTYDVAPDGRFLVIKFPQARTAASTTSLNVVLNFGEELKRLVTARN